MNRNVFLRWRILTRSFVTLEMFGLFESTVTDGTLSYDHDESRGAARGKVETREPAAPGMTPLRWEREGRCS
jgi:hypothetical protein